MLEADRAATVVDMEAGLEHLSRGTSRHVDTLLVVMEPYYKSLETARRCAELGRELGIKNVLGVANKLRGAEDVTVARRYAETHSLPLVQEIPFDDALYHAELAGQAPAVFPATPAVQAVECLTAALDPEENPS